MLYGNRSPSYSVLLNNQKYKHNNTDVKQSSGSGTVGTELLPLSRIRASSNESTGIEDLRYQPVFIRETSKSVIKNISPRDKNLIPYSKFKDEPKPVLQLTDFEKIDPKIKKWCI